MCSRRIPGLGGGSRCVTLDKSAEISGKASKKKKECHVPLQVFYRILQFLSTYMCVLVFSGFTLMSSDPIKIGVAIAVNFTGAWLEFYLTIFSNCTKVSLLVSTEWDRDL